MIVEHIFESICFYRFRLSVHGRKNYIKLYSTLDIYCSLPRNASKCLRNTSRIEPKRNVKKNGTKCARNAMTSASSWKMLNCTESKCTKSQAFSHSKYFHFAVRSSFSDFCQRFGKEERYKAIEKVRERESLFNEYLLEVRRREKEEKQQKKEQVCKQIVHHKFEPFFKCVKYLNLDKLWFFVYLYSYTYL